MVPFGPQLDEYVLKRGGSLVTKLASFTLGLGSLWFAATFRLRTRTWHSPSCKQLAAAAARILQLRAAVADLPKKSGLHVIGSAGSRVQLSDICIGYTKANHRLLFLSVCSSSINLHHFGTYPVHISLLRFFRRPSVRPRTASTPPSLEAEEEEGRLTNCWCMWGSIDTYISSS